MVDVPLTYDVGLVSVAADGTLVSGTGMLWTGINARQWDTIQIDPANSNIILPITSVDDDGVHLSIPAWKGGAKTNVPYVIYQISPLRFVGGKAMADVDQMLQYLNTEGWYRYVNPVYDGPTEQGIVANEGQFALKYTTGELWIMTGGVWVIVPQMTPYIPTQQTLYFNGDSWLYVDTTGPTDSMRVAFQTALDAKFGANAWKIINNAVGGTTLTATTGGEPNFIARLTGSTLNRGDATEIIIGTAINDISLGKTDTQIITGWTTIKANCLAAGKPFIGLLIPPFKGAAFYNSTTRGYADNVNAWMRANLDQYFDTWTVFNDTGNDGAIKAAYANGFFHLNQAGKDLIATTIVNTLDMHTIDAQYKLHTNKDVYFDQSVRRNDKVAFKNVIIGEDNGAVRPLTIRTDDMLVDKEHISLAQQVSPDAGIMQHADNAGNLAIKRFAGGSLKTVFTMKGLGGYETRSFDYVQSTGGVAGVGTSLLASPIAADAGWSYQSYILGGFNFGKFQYIASEYSWTIGGTEKLKLDTSGNTTVSGAFGVGGTTYLNDSVTTGSSFAAAGFVQGTRLVASGVGGTGLPALDASASNLAIANGATIVLAANGCYLMQLRDNGFSGETCLLMLNLGGGITIIAQTIAVTTQRFFVTASPAAGTYGISYSSGSFRITNNTGSASQISHGEIKIA